MNMFSGNSLADFKTWLEVQFLFEGRFIELAFRGVREPFSATNLLFRPTNAALITPLCDESSLLLTSFSTAIHFSFEIRL